MFCLICYKRYEAGLVTKVYAISSDPYWSVNIKRGIISLMNLDLNIANPVAMESSMSKSFMGVINSDYNTMSEKSVYRVIEVNYITLLASYCYLR
jgi:L-fucose mutarotase/ribose pyranase (RbsD/FucU family)